MPPRIVRPRSDRGHWIAGTACGVAALVVGYAVAARVFAPGTQSLPEGGEVVESQGGAPEPVDAGAAPIAQEAPDAAVVPPPPAAPRVPVRVLRAVVQSCGDGEELNIPGPRCVPVPGLEEALRVRLARLGDCPGAEVSARTPDATLSLGLRVDFARHRVTPLPGRSSTLANALPYVACARTVVERVDELWGLAAPHVRYLYFFSVRFGPLAAPPAAPPAPAGASGATPDAGRTAAETSGATREMEQGVLLPQPESATLVWDRVMLRAAPRDGAVITRLPRGAQVTVVARQGDWYRVRSRAGEGWLFGEAIGR
jgi:hypothetical protein